MREWGDRLFHGPIKPPRTIMKTSKTFLCASGAELLAQFPRGAFHAVLHVVLGLLLLAPGVLWGPTLYGQRSDLVTQVPGGFLLLEDLCAIGSSDVIAVGHTEQGFRFGAVSRINNGTTVWSKKLRNSEPYYANTFHAAVSIASNTDILVAGQEVRHASGCHLARLDQAGNLVWSTTMIVGPGAQNFATVQEALDGNIYTTGTIGDLDDADLVIAKFDPNGTPLWTRIVDEIGEQYARSAVLVNDTLHLLGSTASNNGDVALLSFSPEGDLVRSLTLGTPLSERPLSMTHDGAGSLLICYGRSYYDMAIAHVGPNPDPTVPTWSIDTPLQLDLQGGIHFDPVSGECLLLGNRTSMALAMKISLANSTVVWDRSFPDFYTFFGMTLTGDGATLIASGGPFGYLPNGSYPVELAQLDPTTGNDRSGIACVPSSPNYLSISPSETPCQVISLATRIPVVEVSFGIEVSDMPLISNFCMPTTLPVELYAWSAEQMGHMNLLTWSTASEQNSARFIIERSLDAHLWEPLGEMQAAGNSSIPLHYTWNDAAPLVGTSYYRLQQEDLDGSKTTSDIRAVEWTGSEPTPLFYPNPATSGQWVKATEPVHVVDPLGRTILGPVLEFAAPERAGLYLVQALDRCERLLVQ